MTDYFDEDAFGEALTDNDVRNVARRQLAVSFVVGFAFLAAALFAVVSGYPAANAGAVARAPQTIERHDALEIAQPALMVLRRG